FVALFIALFTSIVLLTGAVNKSLGASEALHALVVRDVPAVTPTPDRLDPAPPTEASSLPVPGNAPSGTPGTERVTGL
ncbi:MAG: hypothetical protein LBR80_04440, partial [Deltaproteobacteria bacterium]|nr:hypothetical protein [Deltaproteobacteria bacterium]